MTTECQELIGTSRERRKVSTYSFDGMQSVILRFEALDPLLESVKDLLVERRGESE